jgi:hypothetical protein
MDAAEIGGDPKEAECFILRHGLRRLWPIKVQNPFNK